MYMLSSYLKDAYGRKLYKLSLDAGFTCPNRDGGVGYGGCIFCSEGGSGDFAVNAGDIDTMITEAKKVVSAKFKPTPDEPSYIAYFQAFTNTYAPIERLKELYMGAINHPDIAILSVATRPDCLPDEVVDLLSDLNKVKPVWVELGLQTTDDDIAEYINRGYKTEVYYDAVKRLNEAGIKVITHVIMGLPGEDKEQMLSTIRSVVDADSWGIKLQVLHVLKGTKLAEVYEENPFHIITFDEYLNLIREADAIIPNTMVVHRLTGDGPKKHLIEPKWTADKKRVLNAINAIIYGEGGL